MTPRRVASGAFNQLNPTLVREFKEAFDLLDKDGKGHIAPEDVEEMFVQLGQVPAGDEVKKMMASLPSPITFSVFLTFMSNAIAEISSREELTQAFSAFSDDNSDAVSYSALAEALVEDGMDASDVEAALGAFKARNGFRGDVFRHKDFIDVLRGSA